MTVYLLTYLLVKILPKPRNCPVNIGSHPKPDPDPGINWRIFCHCGPRYTAYERECVFYVLSV